MNYWSAWSHLRVAHPALQTTSRLALSARVLCLSPGFFAWRNRKAIPASLHFPQIKSDDVDKATDACLPRVRADGMDSASLPSPDLGWREITTPLLPKGASTSVNQIFASQHGSGNYSWHVSHLLMIPGRQNGSLLTLELRCRIQLLSLCRDVRFRISCRICCLSSSASDGACSFFKLLCNELLPPTRSKYLLLPRLKTHQKLRG